MLQSAKLLTIQQLLNSQRVNKFLNKFFIVCVLGFSAISFSAISYADAPAAPVIDLRPSDPTVDAPSTPTTNKNDSTNVAAAKTTNINNATVNNLNNNNKETATKNNDTLVKTNSATSPSVTQPSAAQFTTETKNHSSTFKPSNASCSNSQTEHWQKSLVTTSFPRTEPTQTNAGRLYQVSDLLPQLLSDRLFKQHAVVKPAYVNNSLPETTLYNQHQIAELTQKLANHQNSQLVLSGEILDMSMAHPEATYSPSFYTRVLNNVFDTLELKNRFEKRDRLFHFRVNLLDGVTGENIFSQDYRTYGVWSLTGEVNFGSDKFWQTDYGRQINGLLTKATKDLTEVIQCQPLKASIEARPGQTQIVLQSGSNNGLRVGDTLSLYQVVMQPSETEYQQSEMRLMNRNTAIEVREIYPSHSVAVVKGTTYLAGQFLAVSQ